MTSANERGSIMDRRYWPVDYRCDTGGCPQVTYSGDTVTIVETANPGQVVVTAAAKWDAYLDTVRVQERARIVAGLRLRADKIGASAERTDSLPNMSYAAGLRDAAHLTEMGEFDDLAAGDE